MLDQVRAKGRIGLVVLGSVALGLAIGLVLCLGVFGGGEEAVITGAALLALGCGMLTLFLLARRLTDQPQPWALAPGIGASLTGLALLLFTPGDRVLRSLGWVWPLLLALLVVWSVRGARRSLHNWSRRAVLYPTFVVLGLVAVGGAYETVAEATISNPAPSTGRTYAVEGHDLYLNCVGSGSPAVILFNGHMERTPSWAWIQPDVARETRVCAFDRAGQGWSGEGGGSQDAHELSDDVHALLAAARVPRPYVVAGHSVGGPYALAYAMDFPADVAGVALIDSSTPYQFDLPDYPGFYAFWRRVGATLPSLGRAGITRLTLGRGSSLPPDARRSAQLFAASPRELRANRVEFAELRTVFEQTKELRSLGEKPLYVLSAGTDSQAGWAPAQARLATLSSNAVQRTVKEATHAALVDDERFAAESSDAIAAVVRAVRGRTSVRR
jgi:pimeloyl-ACP methyl ester carboxylesterase